MSYITLSGHFDGQHIQLDDPYPLAPETRVLITVLTPSAFDQESAQWVALSLEGLATAYGPGEPDYTSVIRHQWNPDHA